MKKLILSISMMLIAIFSLSDVAYAANKKEEISLAEEAKSAILLERDTGQVIFSKNEHKKLAPASLTKLMTMLIIMEELDRGNLKKEEKVRVSERAASMGGSQIFLETGEEMTVHDLLKGISIASGNDASVAMAERISGSEEVFATRMNEKAKELGLKHTKFQNATGLPAKEHYSTAHDIAMISKALLKYEDITSYTSIYEDYLRKGSDNEFWLVNTNRLVRFYKGVDGLKTGYTSEAKFCLAATAKKDDMRVISVVMGADTTKERNQITSEMLDYAFGQYETKRLFTKGEIIEEWKHFKSKQGKANIVAAEAISTLHRKTEKKKPIKTEIKIDDEIELPVTKGDPIGKLVVKQGDQVLSSTDLVFDRDMTDASYFTLFKRTMQKLAKYN